MILSQRSIPPILVGAVIAAAMASVSPLTFIMLRWITGITAAAAVPMFVSLACISLGAIAVLPHSNRLTKTEALLMSFGAGVGLLSIPILVAGILGVAHAAVITTILAVALACGLLVTLRHRPVFLLCEDKSKVSAWATVPAVLIAIAAGLMVMAAVAPPLVYDVTEYHLGAASEYLRNPGNRIVPMQHNFYARFPFPVESLYYAGLILDRAAGLKDFSPKVLNLFLVFAGALLVNAWLLRLKVGCGTRLFAALMYLVHPVLLEVSVDAYIDAAVAFSVGCAVFGSILVLDSLRYEERPFTGILPVVGMIWGTAFCSKYTVLQVYLLPAVLVLLGPIWARCRRSHADLWKRRLFLAILFAALPLVFWAGKNIAFYGNPLEPFFETLFRPGDGAAIARETYYIQSHYPQPLWSPEYWTSFPRRFAGLEWITLAPLIAVFLRHDRKRFLMPLLFCLLAYCSWNLIRESQFRFMSPVLLVLIVTATAGLGRLPGLAKAVAFILIGFVVCGNLLSHGIRLSNGGVYEYFAALDPHESSNRKEHEAFLKTNLGSLGDVIAAADKLPKNSRIVLVYEARPYLFRLPTVYNTVFDDSVFLRTIKGARSKEEIAGRLLEAGITHVLVNREELRRFIEQYARPYEWKKLGARNAAEAFFMTPTPEDHYPPFGRSPDWAGLRLPVLSFLKWVDEQATVRAGKEPLQIYLAPVPSR